MSETPMISVIMPIYNMEKCMRRAIDSVLAQTFADFELLLIDDGSKDSSGAICDYYAEKDSRIRVFHKPNGGISSARNCGLDNANGKWVTFCDSDDFVYSEWLANYDVENNREYDLIHQGAKSDKPTFGIGANENFCGIDFAGNPREFLNLLTENGMVGYTWMKAYRLSIIRNNGLTFDTEIRLKEDDVFLAEYLPHCRRVKSVDKQGYFYFAPNWTAKYTLSFNERLYQVEAYLKSIKSLYEGHITDISLRYFKDSYICNMMGDFAGHPKISYLKKIRGLHREDYGCSRLYAPLKWLIVHDGTYLLSWPALYLHSNLRKKFARNK